MYCSQCGTMVKNGAKFCSQCGHRVEQDLICAEQADAALDAENSCGMQKSTISEESNNANLNTQGSLNLNCESIENKKNNESTSDSIDAVPQTTNLKSAVQSNKRRSRRKIPIVVLIALIVAACASVAYAAYSIYNNIWLPAQQQTQAGTLEGAEEEKEWVMPEIEAHSIEVNGPTDPFVNAEGERREYSWVYDTLTNPNDEEAINEINKVIENSFNASAEKCRLTASSKSANQVTINKQIKVTYLSDKYVCFLDTSYITNWGAHGWTEMGSATFNIRTGQRVSPESVFGLSSDEALDLTKTAFRTFMNSYTTGNSLYKPSEVEGLVSKVTIKKDEYTDNNIPDCSRLVISNAGLLYTTDPYEIGSYADGTRRILVKGFDSSALAGETIGGYIYDIQLVPTPKDNY